MFYVTFVVAPSLVLQRILHGCSSVDMKVRSGLVFVGIRRRHISIGERPTQKQPAMYSLPF